MLPPQFKILTVRNFLFLSTPNIRKEIAMRAAVGADEPHPPSQWSGRLCEIRSAKPTNGVGRAFLCSNCGTYHLSLY